ncbi:hypothetical protein K470DRAFT_255574 [Piedraia hortae CBS 480.64]|uniref:Uncharacterized protein n=1 Tax=Piedraia hortae CBS 480.64 TaxID=1314780 RepID=A0A6A7C5X2_9PEZI|nr:hypothetical protein K470DRAFT_255574 [Piedraia hortae CBS 480.64]
MVSRRGQQKLPRRPCTVAGWSARTPASTPSDSDNSSERPSTGVFSVSERSDTVYDSIPRVTYACHKRGPPIETLFHDSPPLLPSSSRSTRLGDYLTPVKANSPWPSSPPEWDDGEDKPVPFSSPLHLMPQQQTHLSPYSAQSQSQRGSRSNGRRAPSLHARSHSVPVVPDVEGKRCTKSSAAQKFGTWGIGSKVITEDWNEDFDFDELPPVPTLSMPNLAEGESKTRPHTANPTPTHHNSYAHHSHTISVPIFIRERQQSVVAHLSLLREWGLVIEDLKELRLQADTMGLATSPLWQEVDAMIDLADCESGESRDCSGEHARSPSPVASTSEPDVEPISLTTKSLSTSPYLELNEDEASGLPPGEAMARTVIDILRSSRKSPAKRRKEKLPFDTATLKYIVPHVQGLRKQCQELVLGEPKQRRTSMESWDLSSEEEEESRDAPLEMLFAKKRTCDENTKSKLTTTTKTGDLMARFKGLEV